MHYDTTNSNALGDVHGTLVTKLVVPQIDACQRGADRDG